MSENEEYVPPSAPQNTGRQSIVIMHLREHGPATSAELPSKAIGNSRNREVVARLNPMRGRNAHGSSKTRPTFGDTTRVVYYLYGDERRAVRKFIDENTEFVASCMADSPNPINTNVDPIIWQMFVEEVAWGDWEVDNGD